MGGRLEIGWAALLAVVLVAVASPNGVQAANVVNGNFESGTLNGWQVYRATTLGNWFAYTGTEAPIGSRRPTPADPVQAPPQGAFAAIADQANPDTLILYQDVSLETGLEHRLSLLAYYDSYKPIAVPNPDTLSVDEEVLRLPNGKFQKNQQFRIDVMKPEAPLESLDPGDVLRTVFATKPGDPARMVPKKLNANLSAFAGQTVRIRIVTAVREEVFNAGIDAVSIASTAPGRIGSRRGGRRPTLFSFGRLEAKLRKGTATLRVRVSGPGLLRARATSVVGGTPFPDALGGARKPIEPVTVPIAMARTVTLHLRPTATARAWLRRRHRLRVQIAVTFMPFDGASETATLPVAFRLARTSK